MDTVERVARAIFRAQRGHESDMCAKTDMLWPTGEEWRNEAWAQFEPAARAAIEALRDNVTDGMIEAANNAEYFSIEGIDILYMMDGNKEDFRNVLRAGIDAALNEENK